jgi:hypothetical protein
MPTTYRECLGVRFCAQQHVGILALLLSAACSDPAGPASAPGGSSGSAGTGGVIDNHVSQAGGGGGGNASGGNAGTPTGAGSGGVTAAGASPGGSGGGSGGSSSGGSSGSAGTGGAPLGAPMPPYRFIHGYSGGSPKAVRIVGKNKQVEWELALDYEEANDAWGLPNGNVLFGFRSGDSSQTGCREVNMAKQTVFEYRAPSGGETHSCQRLPSGDTLVGVSFANSTSQLLEVGADLKVHHMVTISEGGESHSQFREVRKTAKGTYLVVQQRGGGKAMEFDGDGKKLRTFPCGSFVAIRLPNENTLISCGDDHRVVEVAPDDSIVWEITESEIPGNKLGFVGGLQRLPNGNTLICNWPGHGGGLFSEPEIFELTPAKQVVWTYTGPDTLQVSSFQILDPEAFFPDGNSYR